MGIIYFEDFGGTEFTNVYPLPIEMGIINSIMLKDSLLTSF